jgi:5-formyltetrahydrofolate cyclo-ligase
MTLNEQKAALRREIRAALHKISVTARAAASAQLCARVKEQPFWNNAASVLFFAPLPDEPDVWPLLEKTAAKGKIAALPCFVAADRSYAARRIQNPRGEIVLGQFGIREPKSCCAEMDLRRLDLILVPGVAFDLSGRRLGRGRGFYDRLLVETPGLKCGVAFEEQIAGEAPAGAHDQRMDFILTPARCVETAGQITGAAGSSSACRPPNPAACSTGGQRRFPPHWWRNR